MTGFHVRIGSHILAGADSTTVVAHTATLEGFVSSVATGNGINLYDLEPMTALVVTTCNSHYRIIASGNAAICVQGGRYFEAATDAKLEGSSAGGSFLKVAWIGVGLRMEISFGGRRIVTSPVRTITRDDAVCSLLTH